MYISELSIKSWKMIDPPSDLSPKIFKFKFSLDMV